MENFEILFKGRNGFRRSTRRTFLHFFETRIFTVDRSVGRWNDYYQNGTIITIRGFIT